MWYEWIFNATKVIKTVVLFHTLLRGKIEYTNALVVYTTYSQYQIVPYVSHSKYWKYIKYYTKEFNCQIKSEGNYEICSHFDGEGLEVFIGNYFRPICRQTRVHVA